MELNNLLHTVMNSRELIHYGGFSLLLIVVFAETGVFFGFFLPGDYLLFTAGLLCGSAALDVPIWTLLIGVTIAAVFGNLTGYWSGSFLKNKVLNGEKGSFFFKPEMMERTRLFFQKHGTKALIFSRFLPVVRTFTPILAGAVSLPFQTYLKYNFIGSFLWVWTMIPMGYFLGTHYPSIVNYLEYIIIAFVVFTAIPVIIGFLKLRIETKKPESGKPNQFIL
jgi:membrane-associated protein